MFIRLYLAFQLCRNVSDTSGPKSIPMEGISGSSDGGGGIEGGESDGRTGSVDGDAVFNGVVIGLAVTLLIMILALAVRKSALCTLQHRNIKTPSHCFWSN